MLIQNCDQNYWGGLCYDCKLCKSYDSASRMAKCTRWGRVKGVGVCKYFIPKAVKKDVKRLP